MVEHFALSDYSDRLRERLRDEVGTLFQQGKRRVALVYPSPYRVAMSSLGYQQVYRIVSELPDTVCERATLPDDDEEVRSLLTLEGQVPVGDFPVLAFSVAYELELAGIFDCLRLSGVSSLRVERAENAPFVLMGGPLTFSNPTPLGPFADAVIMGEAEDLLAEVMEVIFSSDQKLIRLKRLAAIDGVWVPEVHGDALPKVAACLHESLPAYSVITTPHTELSNMFLLEPERGCSRACSFCVMRRSTNGGMRLVDHERVLSLVPEYVKKVGLVGAAVSDHPKICNIVESLVEEGRRVSLASMRADRMTPRFVAALKAAGYRTLTVASDGASERLREGLEKRIRQKHLLRTAELCAEMSVPMMKLYMMIGVPTETDADLDELIESSLALTKALGKHSRLAMGVAPFVAKRNTPLDGMPFCGIREVDRRMKYLRKALRGRVDVRPVSSRWAYIEYCLAQGGQEAGLSAYQAHLAGGRFAHYKKVFAHIPTECEREVSALPKSPRKHPRLESPKPLNVISS